MKPLGDGLVRGESGAYSVTPSPVQVRQIHHPEHVQQVQEGPALHPVAHACVGGARLECSGSDGSGEAIQRRTLSGAGRREHPVGRLVYGLQGEGGKGDGDGDGD